jgi:ElaA protein
MERLEVHRAGFAELDPHTLYALLKLRQDVFVVEQKCAFPEIDGRDVEPGVLHLWVADESGPLSYLRVFGADAQDETDGPVRIGRVVTAAHARGRGLSAALMRAALDLVGDRPSVLDAQVESAPFYAKFGFELDGPEYLEDDIPHIQMTRPANARAEDSIG